MIYWVATITTVWTNSAVTCKHMVFWLTTSLLFFENEFFRRRRASARKMALITSSAVTTTNSFIISWPRANGAGPSVD